MLWVGERKYPEITQIYAKRGYKDVSGSVLRSERVRIPVG